jgi:diguanylate cyclase (GGDEF)-like protein/PAS domain S-box-containing protein
MPTKPAEKPDAQVFRFDQSGALLRKVMESAAVGMAVVGADGRMIYANRAYETMLGYADDGSLGLSVNDMLFDEDRQVTSLHLARLMRGEADEFHHECRLKHVDGNPIWVLASGSLLRSDATGRPLYVIMQIINIERQKRAEVALAESESRWNFALESAGQGVWDHDIRKDDMFYSPMWRKMRGIPKGEYVDPAQELWLQRLHPDDAKRIKAIVKKQDSGEDGYDTLEYRERHRDGHYIWILSRGKPVEWDRDGKPIRTVGTDTDITRLKAVEAELADEKERLRVTLESIGDGVICADAEEKIIFMNPVAEHMTGWGESEAMGRTLAEVFVAKSEATGEPAADPVAACLQNSSICTINDDVVLASRDGIGRGVSGTASPVRTEEGHTIGAVLVFKDITETQELQRALAHSANHDALTGLPNRAAFTRALSEAHRQADVELRSHALCFIDLDRFKPVNDAAGHAAGDALLQKVAQVIRRTCRSHDMAARLGGDEFVVLLADCTLGNARAVAEKVVDSIAKLDFVWNAVKYSIGASAGVAMIKADVNQDALAEADAACYAAKAAGRGRVATSAS